MFEDQQTNYPTWSCTSSGNNVDAYDGNDSDDDDDDDDNDDDDDEYVTMLF